MKIIDLVTSIKKMQTISNYCPSDYGYKDLHDSCTFSKTGAVTENECLKCWSRELDETEPKEVKDCDY